MSGDNSVRTQAAPAPQDQDGGAATLRLDDVLALRAQLDMEAKRLYGRAVRAIKVGRRELVYLRTHIAAPSMASYGGLAWPPDSLLGIPFYEVAMSTYFEPIYVEEAPDLAALNARLMAYPPLRGGPLRAE